MNIRNFENEGRKFVNNMGNFHVLEYLQDASVSPMNASTEYFMSKMGVHRRQLVIQLDENNSAIVQAGAMQWSAGNIEATSGIKGVGDLFGKMVKGAVTKESAVKPEYVGNGFLTLEPTYKFIILVDVGSWGSGITIEDGMFYACSGTVKNTVVARKNLSSAALGGEGLFNLSLSGSGIAALESNVPYNELVEVELENDTLRIDGNLAVCWSSNLEFTVERSTKTLLGSAVSGEGLVNVYRGTGKVLMSPVAPTSSLYAATNTVAAKAAAITSNTLGH
ncbi:AIM24 family protein [Butyrivibrio sp. WCD3002]|uniref:AIM24 family protein n=1 Tax=Butyrivibrio sp. WCD3002 TaxID=1280676 RepID=UPI000408C894|nr:AIM24 family protein [Butyrivibrio sp. WCD3002]